MISMKGDEAAAAKREPKAPKAQLRSINEAELRGEGWSEDEITRALADIDKGVRRVTGSPAKVGGTRSVAKSNDKKVAGAAAGGAMLELPGTTPPAAKPDTTKKDQSAVASNHASM